MPTVLVADDEPPILELVRFTLEDEQVRVVEATSGPAALEVARRERPDLIFLDVHMPGLDGFEVCRQLKSETATRLIPVILITALQAPEDRIRGIESGADDFITKPFNQFELRARVRSA